MARPSTYDTAFCEQVIEWGEQGKSITWMAAQLDVSRECIYEWARVHTEFSDALSRARAKAQAHWEDMGHSGVYAPGFNGSVWVKSMAARFPEDWREKSETAHTGPSGGPVQTVTRIELVPLTNDSGPSPDRS